MKRFIFCALLLTACGEDPDQINNYLMTSAEKTAPKLSLLVADGSAHSAGDSSYLKLFEKAGFKTANKAVPNQNAKDMLAAEDVDEEIEVKEKPADSPAASLQSTSEEGKTLDRPMVIYLEGLNSYRAGQTPEEAYDALIQYVAERKEKGWLTTVVTMVPSLQLTLGANKWRQIYNGLIIENAAEADYIVNLDVDFRLADCTSLTYFEADQMNLTKSGSVALYENIAATLARAGYQP